MPSLGVTSNTPLSPFKNNWKVPLLPCKKTHQNHLSIAKTFSPKRRGVMSIVLRLSMQVIHCAYLVVIKHLGFCVAQEGER